MNIEMNGWLTQENSYVPSSRNFGPNGYNSCSKARTVLRYMNEVVAWMSPNCNPDTQQTHTASNYELTGPVKAVRSKGDTICTQNPEISCISYTGYTSITITMVSGTLSVVCSPSFVRWKQTIGCTASSNLPSKFVQVQSWQWAPDVGNANNSPCSGGPSSNPCSIPNVEVSGTVTVNALVNGEAKVATVRVKRICWSDDSLLWNSPPLRGALQAVWDSSQAHADHIEYGMSVLSSGSGAPTPGDRCGVRIRIPSTRIAVIHAHGLPFGDSVQMSCFTRNPADTQWVYPGSGLSQPDAVGAGLFGPIYVIDSDSIFRLRSNEVTVDSSERNPGGSRVYRALDGWESHVRSYPRTGPNACVLP